jgi:hypothetical protein
MGSTNSTKNASKISAVKALAKGLIGNRKDMKKKGAEPTKAVASSKGAASKSNSQKPVAAKSNGKTAASQNSQKAPMKATTNGNKRTAASAAAPAPAPKASAKNGAKAAAAPATSKAPSKPASAKASKSSSRVGGSLLGSRGGNSEAETVCREVACEGLSTTAGYCRLHYIKNWKKIKRKELILKEGKLNQYIEELVAKYPDKYIEAIRQDLASDKDFAKVIYDLDLDESVDDFDVEGENVDSLIDTIKRDFDDEGEGGF